jgi:CheY-like chemotaxis protein
MGSEIRTALNAMIGMTELALETDVTSKRREYLDLVKASADSLALVLNNLLDFSLIELDRFDIDPIEFSLRDSLGYTMGTLALRVHQQGVELVSHVLRDVPDWLVGDPWILRKIVVILIDHVIKSTQRGVVVLRVEQEGQTEEGVQLRFAVTVTEAVERSESRPSGDTSPSLALASRLADLLGGRFWVEHDLDHSGALCVRARFGLRKTPVEQPIPAEPTRARGLRVLVADGNATNRRILREMLTNWQMKPVAVNSGESALAALEQAYHTERPFALMLLDANISGMDGFALAEQITQHRACAGTQIILLTSTGQRGDAARCRKLGVAGYLTRPMKHSELFDAIMTVLGTPSGGDGRPLLVTRHSLRENRRFLRILLVEDNPVNRMLALRLLERRGHTVVVAHDGREALAALEQQHVDVVLLDLERPELDGLTVTTAIREREHTAGRSVKVVAMTTPFQAKALVEAVEGVVRPSASGQGGGADGQPADELCDQVEVLARVDGDQKLLRELVELFLSECPHLLCSIREAAARRDRKALERAAHTLHGSVSTFSAKAACEAAQRLETMACHGDLTGAEEACAALEAAIERLKPSLLTFFSHA